MTPDLPKQRRRCSVYAWCTGHAGPGEIEHRGRAHVVPALEGRELRLVLTAVGHGPMSVRVEMGLTEGGPSMDVVELDPAEVLRAAATLRQLALESQERVNDNQR